MFFFVGFALVYSYVASVVETNRFYFKLLVMVLVTSTAVGIRSWIRWSRGSVGRGITISDWVITITGIRTCVAWHPHALLLRRFNGKKTP